MFFVVTCVATGKPRIQNTKSLPLKHITFGFLLCTGMNVFELHNAHIRFNISTLDLANKNIRTHAPATKSIQIPTRPFVAGSVMLKTLQSLCIAQSFKLNKCTDWVEFVTISLIVFTMTTLCM